MLTTRVTVALPALMFSVMLACSSSPPPHEGSSLSQAADEAKKSDEEKKKALTATPKEEQEHAPAVVAATTTAAVVDATSPADSSAPAPIPSDSGEDIRAMVSLFAGGGGLGSEDFDGFGVFGVGLGFRVEERVRVGLSFLYIPTQLTENSGVVDALTDEKEVALDVFLRYYFTPAHTFAGLYGVIGGRAGWLMWNYANDITVVDENGNPRTLEDDRLTYYAGYLGVGVAPVQTEHITLGVDLDVGLKTFESYTSEGFNQDLFDDFIEFTQLQVSVDYRF